MSTISFHTVTPEWVNGVPIPIDYPRRRHWHCIPERDKKSVPIDKTLVGKWVRVGKFIRRTGYYFEPMDAAPSMLNEIVEGIVIRGLKKALGKIDVSREQYDSLIIEFPSIEMHPTYEARGIWLQEVYRLEQYAPYKNLRTFWYVDVKDVNPEETVRVFLTGVTRHVVGRRQPARSYGYYGEDYDPAYLGDAVHQMVYRTRTHIAVNYPDYWCGEAEIHPLDILEVEK